MKIPIGWIRYNGWVLWSVLTMHLAGCGFGVGQDCGGIAAIPCGFGQYCKYETGVCGEGDQTGVCEMRPQSCTLDFAPVCGCDGETYANECVAASEGVSVDHTGECELDGKPGEGDVCGGIVPLLCDEGLYCHYEEGICGEGDQTGVCKDLPEACIEIYAPVCGCDGETYGNECIAAAAGVSVEAEGECP